MTEKIYNIWKLYMEEKKLYVNVDGKACIYIYIYLSLSGYLWCKSHLLGFVEVKLQFLRSQLKSIIKLARREKKKNGEERRRQRRQFIDRHEAIDRRTAVDQWQRERESEREWVKMRPKFSRFLDPSESSKFFIRFLFG